MENQYAQMVDLGFRNITQVPSTRYPVYTRGNAGEVWQKRLSIDNYINPKS